MKTQGLSVFAICLIFSCGAFSADAQNYKIDWYTIDGGGGTSSGGSFSLSGTIGQPDAGKLSGGNFVLDGGFWGGVFAVQQVGAPTLHIVRSGANVIISLDPAAPGFVLQEIGNLSLSNWAFSGSGSTHPVTVPASNATRFYRLIKQ
jgi:hypothetical protein